MRNRLAAFLRGFVYAGRGIWYCLRRERNFRIHLTVGAYVLLFAGYFPLTRSEWAVLLLTLGLVPTAEAINTAIEKAVDTATSERRETARIAKDAAAGAVLLAALAAVAVGAALFWRPAVFAEIAADFLAYPQKPLLLALSLPVAFWFAFRNAPPKNNV